uniref:Uncharacterized protein n=1 Tax=Candidatus Kentrum sp. TC TaxID=2126339 RepID=A0A450Y875_9GAMM|nr:MAG: hypothetical protein BECKTC1821D_GA0114238_100242 [Candidatus Kentron sp. TC]VFK40884.1 MAG: hypothetical protein BECKTC1821E_GA0114239_100839 [Candidatus Kentron sp. TC]VFK53723.1 MAG: hypothetical protein BECKTC1821F_GA0114240_100339 [Candidatus Kentron sp. TC]
MKKDLYCVPEIYLADDDGGFYEFTLENGVFYAQLIPFLKSICPLLCNKKYIT